MPHKCAQNAARKKKEWYEKNKEATDAWQKNYRIVNAALLSEKTKKWQRENPEKYKAKNKLWNDKYKDKKRSTVMKNEYGITLADYNKMFDLQNGRCAICSKHQSELKRALHIDHCHKTGKVRSLLCQHCNTLLGFANDDIEVLKKSILYLSIHSTMHD